MLTEADYAGEGGGAAAGALRQALLAGKHSTQLLDAMESAEEEFNVQHPETFEAAGAAAASGGGQGAPTVGSESRQRVLQALLGALAANPAVAAQGRAAVEAAAQQCEQALFEGSHRWVACVANGNHVC